MPRRPPTVTSAGLPATTPGRPRSQLVSSVDVVPTPGSGVVGQAASCDRAMASRNTYRPRFSVPAGRSCTQVGVSAASSQPSGTVNVSGGWNAVVVYVPAGIGVVAGTVTSGVAPGAGGATAPPQAARATATTIRARVRDAANTPGTSMTRARAPGDRLTLSDAGRWPPGHWSRNRSPGGPRLPVSPRRPDAQPAPKPIASPRIWSGVTRQQPPTRRAPPSCHRRAAAASTRPAADPVQVFVTASHPSPLFG